MISYDSYSKDLTHIADRRREGLWINRADFQSMYLGGKDFDVQIITPLSNLYLLDDLDQKTKVILDMVDGYLVEKPNWIKDYARFVLRNSLPKSLFALKRNSQNLKEVCKRVDLVVVASNEQAEVVRQFNSNVFVIRDCHEELGPPLDLKPIVKTDRFDIFWEGLGYTLFHFKEIASDLIEFLLDTNSKLHLVTNESFPRFAGKFGKIESAKVVQQIFGRAAQNVYIYSWSQQAVEAIAKQCDFGIIPILETDQFARLKPENKLLIFWRLGLQTLFSDLPSYERLSSQIGVTDYCVKTGEWGDKLRQISNSPGFLSSKMPSAKQYLLEFHSRELILSQWKTTLQSLSKLDNRERYRT